jgi:hypothetical protein
MSESRPSSIHREDAVHVERLSQKSDRSDGEKGDKDEVLVQIFGNVGDLAGDFSCAVQSKILLHGRMYVTKRFLCFYSNLFGLEKKIRVPFKHIQKMTKETTALVIPNAISIQTPKKEYTFRSFWDRDDAYTQLKKFWDQCRDTDEEDSPMGLSPHAPRGSNIGVKSEELETDHGRQDLDAENEEDGDPLTLFEEEIKKNKYKIAVLKGQLNIDLDGFYKNFIEDGCAHSWRNYHESEKDTNLVDEDWTHVSNSIGYTKEIKFLKPVNLPGLKSTRGKKVQRFRRFGDAGLFVISSTRLEDVPAADTFSVDDIVAVRAIEGGKVEVEICFQVTFIKSTILKYMIESNTNSEMTKWLQKFFKQGLEKVVDGGDEAIEGEVSVTTAQPTSAKGSKKPKKGKEKPSAAAEAPAEAKKTLSASENSMPDNARPVKVIDSKAVTYAAVVLLVLYMVVMLYCVTQLRMLNKKMSSLDSLLDEVRAMASCPGSHSSPQDHHHGEPHD